MLGPLSTQSKWGALRCADKRGIGLFIPKKLRAISWKLRGVIYG